ncbi:MAG: hypothetical protein QOF77_203 [Solirubrobacteraceae bacterium]|jgi:hypothetical protein|nr:hypothetical protein [Solirubrobacteraceae bacterium]
MAQTKRKRPSKHRGNAAGMIEARGRTGRKPTPGEKRPATGTPAAGKTQKAKGPKADKYDTPPTWRGALNRALIASAFVLGLSILVLGFKPAQMIAVLPLILAVYVPLGYYTDLFIYRRRQRQKAGP